MEEGKLRGDRVVQDRWGLGQLTGGAVWPIGVGASTHAVSSGMTSGRCPFTPHSARRRRVVMLVTGAVVAGVGCAWAGGWVGRIGCYRCGLTCGSMVYGVSCDTDRAEGNAESRAAEPAAERDQIGNISTQLQAFVTVLRRRKVSRLSPETDWARDSRFSYLSGLVLDFRKDLGDPGPSQPSALPRPCQEPVK